MKTVLAPLSASLLVIALSGCDVTGGGWIPSADQNVQHKASFGVSYKCNDTTHTLTGNFTYHDHGTGQRLAGKINNLLVDQYSQPIGCGEVEAPGVSLACVVVKTGSGGVQAGDVVVLATGDSRPFTGPNDQDAMELVLIHPPTPLDPNAQLSTPACQALLNSNTAYYQNYGVLGGGNITWSID